jgi:hypothetical protein
VVELGDARLPALTELSAQMLEASLAAWGRQRLELAPAFRD